MLVRWPDRETSNGTTEGERLSPFFHSVSLWRVRSRDILGVPDSEEEVLYRTCPLDYELSSSKSNSEKR